MVILYVNNKFYQGKILGLFVADTPLRVQFSDEEKLQLEKFLKTEEGKKIPLTDHKKIVRFIVATYIKEHS